MLSLSSFSLLRKRGKRLGRGIGSGLGKTCGRGHKGQRARSSNIGGFEGGQLPIIRALPKRGFTSNRRYKRNYALIDLAVLRSLVVVGRISTDSIIDLDLCKKLGIVRCGARFVKVLGDCEAPVVVNLKVHAISSGARAMVERAGGVCELI